MKILFGTTSKCSPPAQRVYLDPDLVLNIPLNISNPTCLKPSSWSFPWNRLHLQSSISVELSFLPKGQKLQNQPQLLPSSHTLVHSVSKSCRLWLCPSPSPLTPVSTAPAWSEPPSSSPSSPPCFSTCSLQSVWTKRQSDLIKGSQVSQVPPLLKTPPRLSISLRVKAYVLTRSARSFVACSPCISGLVSYSSHLNYGPLCSHPICCLLSFLEPIRCWSVLKP